MKVLNFDTFTWISRNLSVVQNGVFILFILLLCKPHAEYKNTDNDWNHLRPASFNLN